MKIITKPILIKAGLPALLATGILAATLTAQQAPVDPATHAAHVAAGTMPPDAPAAGDPALSKQLSQLQAKNAQLEAALAKSAPPTAAMPGMSAAAPAAPAAAAAPAMGMGMKKMKAPAPMAGMAPGGAAPAPAMQGMGSGGGMMAMMDKMMGMMDKMMSMGGGAMPAGGPPMAAAPPTAAAGMGGMMPMEMGGMPAPMPAPAPAAGMAAGGMSMMPMDKMKMAGMMGMGAMSGGAPGAMPQSALPGFPGATHLYHLGATGFFLDHGAHIALTTEQTAALNQAKEKASLAKSTADRVIEQAEQELWTLTASDQPDITAIEAKTSEIGKLTGETRVAFIRAVGEASKLLTDEQRKVLTGFAPPAPAMPAAGMAAPAAPMAPMSDM